jgi:hypothetical protein
VNLHAFARHGGASRDNDGVPRRAAELSKKVTMKIGRRREGTSDGRAE